MAEFWMKGGSPQDTFLPGGEGSTPLPFLCAGPVAVAPQDEALVAVVDGLDAKCVLATEVGNFDKSILSRGWRSTFHFYNI